MTEKTPAPVATSTPVADPTATSSFTVQNTQEGPRGFTGSDGVEKMLDPGAKETFDLTEAQATQLKTHGFKLTAGKASAE